ncbi:hypothetical protein JCGZ_26452 [Jatropha curcas]|uniref:F-box domain-containing protein n=2 Tax=Jatropha curcas TaxID=180498 RepID=A0A067JYS1_JATCU|nr:hypothetical protein JCGZ_26452 [Jatropha curcas]
MANNSTADSHSLRDDIVKDILSRLPIKSIKRFESVSKGWYFLFNSHEFISTHLRTSSLRPFLLVRQFHNPTGSKFSLCLIDGNTSYEIRIPFLGCLYRFPKIVGSCNGLICLDISPCYAFGFVLWNITTKQYKFLPRPRINDAHKPIWMVATGFGYNRRDNDYKLVRIVNFHCKDDDSPAVIAEVYSWRTGSWKLMGGNVVEENFGYCVIHEGQQAVSINGSLNWLANGIGKLANEKFIVSFDMVSEEFRRIEIPDYGLSGICAKILEFKESLALAMYSALPVYPGYARPINRFDLWVFNDGEDYGADGHGVSVNKKCWSRIHGMEFSSSGVSTPIGVYNNSELLVKRVEAHGVTLSFFDLYNLSIKHMPFCGPDYTCEFSSYVNSLVPVSNPGYDVVEVQD